MKFLKWLFCFGWIISLFNKQPKYKQLNKKNASNESPYRVNSLTIKTSQLDDGEEFCEKCDEDIEDCKCVEIIKVENNYEEINGGVLQRMHHCPYPDEKSILKHQILEGDIWVCQCDLKWRWDGFKDKKWKKLKYK